MLPAARDLRMAGEVEMLVAFFMTTTILGI